SPLPTWKLTSRSTGMAPYPADRLRTSSKVSGFIAPPLCAGRRAGHSHYSCGGPFGARRPQISVALLGVAHDFVHGVFDQHPAPMKYRDAFGDAANEMHVVLDDDEAALSAHALEQGDGALDLARRHAGRRLVEQH